LYQGKVALLNSFYFYKKLHLKSISFAQKY